MKLGAHCVLFGPEIATDTDAVIGRLADVGAEGCELGERFFGVDDREKLTTVLDKYHVAEPEARSMCAAEGLLSPLYDFTKRGGCWFCPNASISELRHLYRYHPELWQLLLELQDVPNKPTERFSWRRTFREIDERFRQEGEQLSFYEER